MSEFFKSRFEKHNHDSFLNLQYSLFIIHYFPLAAGARILRIAQNDMWGGAPRPDAPRPGGSRAAPKVAEMAPETALC